MLVRQCSPTEIGVQCVPRCCSTDRMTYIDSHSLQRWVPHLRVRPKATFERAPCRYAGRASGENRLELRPR
jgi:hypothetical protein